MYLPDWWSSIGATAISADKTLHFDLKACPHLDTFTRKQPGVWECKRALSLRCQLTDSCKKDLCLKPVRPDADDVYPAHSGINLQIKNDFPFNLKSVFIGRLTSSGLKFLAWRGNKTDCLTISLFAALSHREIYLCLHLWLHFHFVCGFIFTFSTCFSLTMYHWGVHLYRCAGPSSWHSQKLSKQKSRRFEHYTSSHKKTAACVRQLIWNHNDRQKLDNCR